MTVLDRLRFLIPLLHPRPGRRSSPEPLRYLGPVSVIVTSHNDATGIAATVWSLVGNDYPGLEIIVSDDGSADGTPDIVEALGLPGVFVIRRSRTGRSAALTAGIRYARHDLLVLVDAGTVVETDTVGRLVQHLGDPAVDAVSGTTEVAGRDGSSGPGIIGAFRRSALQTADGDIDVAAAATWCGRPVGHEPTPDEPMPSTGYFDPA